MCFNIDIKVTSDPTRLFPVMASILARTPAILPRLVLGLWHPSFILPSYQHLPRAMQRFHIGASVAFAREWWAYVDGFSMLFDCLVDGDGRRFRADCKRAGKKLGVWCVPAPFCFLPASPLFAADEDLCSRNAPPTPSPRTVNDEREMVMAAHWGLDAVLTDLPTRNLALALRAPDARAFGAVKRAVGVNEWVFPWTRWAYWGVAHVCPPFPLPFFFVSHCLRDRR